MTESQLKTRVKTAVLLVVPAALLLFSALFSVKARFVLLGFGYCMCGVAAFEFARVCSASQIYCAPVYTAYVVY